MRRTASAALTLPPPTLPVSVGHSSMPPETMATTKRYQLSRTNRKAVLRRRQRANYRIRPPLHCPARRLPLRDPACATRPPRHLPMHKLVLLRHGESTWNLSNRFTGWTDVELTPTGIEQARAAGKLLREAGFEFDRAWTSVLQRAIWTLWHALDAMERVWLPVTNDWRLNERHYGALQ